MRLALFPGSFDPITLGHLDILTRALSVFDKIEVTVAVNASKIPLFSVEERCSIIQSCIDHLDNVEVSPFEGLIAEYARKKGATALIRGLRNTSDFGYEHPMALANRHIFRTLETVFFIPSPELAFLSSSIVRDVYKWGGDVSEFVPKPVMEALLVKKKAIKN